MKFLVFADFHYKKNMYASTVKHLRQILHRAKMEDVQFCVHLGDFCNDYKNSTEVVDTYLNNEYCLPVFGIYGNHELESSGNSMDFVTPLLCNQNVIFGGEDAGYWFYDVEGFRLIGLDTNYSYNPELEVWEHNRTASWGASNGNLYESSLSPEQLNWLDDVLRDAKDKGLKVLVFSHDSVSGEWHSTPDAKSARELFAKYKGTVIMCLNGHLHTDGFCVKEDVAYFDVNSVLNGYWAVTEGHHYSKGQKFNREVIDADGNIIGFQDTEFTDLSQGENTWFFKEPLSAVVEIDSERCVKISGANTDWAYGIVPLSEESGVKPCIENRVCKMQ